MKPVPTGNFFAKINAAAKLLRTCSLLRVENLFPRYPEDIPSMCRGKSYQEIWRLLISESCFRIILTDYSFFLFNENAVSRSGNREVSMSYYGCPFSFMSLEDYIVENYGEDYLLLKSEPNIIEEYEQALSENSQIESPVAFRYDYSPDLYNPGRHPASHLHIGLNNEIRIGCHRILDPLSFTAFIIRHQYPDPWQHTALAKHSDLFKYSIRDRIDLVSAEYISELDLLEMYLE